MEKVINKDYSEKIRPKLPDNCGIRETDINELITLLNFCFQKKNNFFIKDFNKRVIKNVYLSYNQLKTNILTPSIETIFKNIDSDSIKTLRFILINFTNNYETINVPENNELLCLVSKDSMKRCLHFFTNLLVENSPVTK